MSHHRPTLATLATLAALIVLAGIAIVVLVGVVWLAWPERDRGATSENVAESSSIDQASSPDAAAGAAPPAAAQTIPAAIAPGPGLPTPAPEARLLRTEPPARDLVGLAVRMGRADEPVRRTSDRPPLDYELGASAPFWVHDIQNERYFYITATLQYVTDQAYFWVQDGQSFDPAALERGAQEFSDTVVPDVRSAFGTEWSPGVDGDPRLHVLHHEYIPGVAGYFSSTDEYTLPVEPHSNEHEMFYITLSTYTPGSYDYLALLAHEFQHMIHWYQDLDEPVWTNEGLSELSALVAGYQAQTGSLFLSNPDVALLEWEVDPGANGPHYAGAFLFFAYLRARHGDDLIRAIVAAPENGPSGIEAAMATIGEPRSFDDSFMDWAVANLTDDPLRADGRYSYRELAIDRVQTTALPDGGINDTVHQYATDYYDVTGAVTDDGRLAVAFSGDAAVSLLGIGAGARSESDAGYSVPMSPNAVETTSGSPSAGDSAVWWSNRGDSADSRLSRTFDLTAAGQAEISFRMWYDLETNWDYAYYLVSTDGGAHWSHVSTAGTTDADPNGNNYGAGLTGASDGWVDETLDLTPFVGGPVSVRFEVVTDDAVNLAGLALDDIRLRTSDIGPGMSNAGNASWTETDVTDVGWEAEGWLWVVPQLQQRWGLQVIVDGQDDIQVHRTVVGPDGTATALVEGIPGDAVVTVAVSGLTPATRDVAAYRLSAVPGP